MLLTSSQVSVAISSVIVVVFTSALFFSGYAIQQRTLRELRAAIRPEPRPSPNIFLPDRFRKTTTELPDGTIVVVDDDGNSSDEMMPRWMREKLAKEARARKAAAEMVIEVKPSVAGGKQKVMKGDKTASSKKKKSRTSKTQKGSTENSQGDEQWDKNLVPNPDDASKKPVSRAERRRLIKEEIQRLSQGDRPTYYQRRLW